MKVLGIQGHANILMGICSMLSLSTLRKRIVVLNSSDLLFLLFSNVFVASVIFLCCKNWVTVQLPHIIFFIFQPFMSDNSKCSTHQQFNHLKSHPSPDPLFCLLSPTHPPTHPLVIKTYFPPPQLLVPSNSPAFFLQYALKDVLGRKS